MRGKFTDFKVEIVYDDKDITKSSVNAVIKTASIDTGIERRDVHLRTADFFDAEKNPEITFKSSRVERRARSFIAHGTFTMHGVSKEIALPFTINGVNKDVKTGKTTLGLTARTSISKKEYGMTWAQPANPSFLGDMVEIELNIITRAGQPAVTATVQSLMSKVQSQLAAETGTLDFGLWTLDWTFMRLRKSNRFDYRRRSRHWPRHRSSISQVRARRWRSPHARWLRLRKSRARSPTNFKSTRWL